MAHHIGVLPTLVLLVVISASGPWLVRRTGLGVWRRAQHRLAEGEVPGREIIDGVLLLAAGVLLTVPGFLTGIVGLLLLLPPVRSVVRRLGARWLARRAVVQVWSNGGPSGGSHGQVITAGSRPLDRPGERTGPHPPRSGERALGRAPDDTVAHADGPDRPARP